MTLAYVTFVYPDLISMDEIGLGKIFEGDQ